MKCFVVGGVVGLLMVVLLALSSCVSATELTFDMEPHERQCFMEDVKQGTDVSVEFQVVYGGRLDIDMEVVQGENIKHTLRGQQTGIYAFKAEVDGEYQFCFSNEMSTLAHKTIYIDVVVGDEDPILDELKDHHVALTQMEASLTTIHHALRSIVDYQTHHRMREATHRKTAEFINERVQWVSTGEMLLLVILALFQIVYLRSLFADKK